MGERNSMARSKAPPATYSLFPRNEGPQLTPAEQRLRMERRVLPRDRDLLLRRARPVGDIITSHTFTLGSQ